MIKGDFAKTELCKSCPYYSCNPVSPKKIENADLMVIGEAPQGWEEEPVSGAAGKYARRIIKEVFGEGSKIVYTTACLCRPNSQDLNAKALSLCSSQFLFKFIEECNPKAILCLGSIAKKIFSEGVVSDVSDVLSSWGGRILGTASHPAVVLRNPATEADFRRTVRQIYNTVNPKHLKKELFTVYDIGALDKAIKDISSWEGFVGSDIETTGLDVLAPDSAVTHVSFGQGSRAYSLYFLKELNPVFKVKTWQFVKQQYAKKNVRHVFHHGVFDTQYLRYHGVEVGPYVDTEVMMFLLNENRIINNLKDLSAEYVGNYEYSIDNKDFIKYGMYSAEDSFMVINLFEQLNKYMTPALWRIMTDIIIPFIRLVQEMMLTGLKVNKEQARSVSRSLREEKTKLYADFLEKFKMFRGINIASSDQLVKVLLSQNIPLGKKTKSKESYSVDYEVMQQLSAGGYSWADYIIKMREIDKLTSTYVDKLPKTVQADGRIHCEIDVLGTSTGRPSCSKPNLLNIPRNKDIYRMFVADTGKIYVYADMCLHGDTQLDMYGGHKKISDVVCDFQKGFKQHVYCYMPDKNRIGLSRVIDGKCTGRNRKLVRVWLDNGKYIDATPDHKFMLRDGGYCEAGMLVPGTSLMPCYTLVKQDKKSKVNYRFKYPDNNQKGCWLREHTIVASDVMGVDIKDKSMVVHHKDHNGCNNSLSNLAWITRKEHMVLHGKEGMENPNKNSVNWNTTLAGRCHQSESTRLWWATATEDEIEQRKIRISQGMVRSGCFKGKNNPRYGKHCSQETKDKISKARMGKGGLFGSDNPMWIDGRTNNKRCLDCNKKIRLQSTYCVVCAPKHRMHKFFNHKVAKVEFLVETADVYNITVEKYHNFALSAGVVVKNSQAEVRTISSLANEQVMIDAYRNDKDLHRITASVVTGKNSSDITKEERQLAKGIMFGLLYGSTAEGLKSYLFSNYGISVSLEEAVQFRNAFFAMYPALPVYYKKLEDEVRTTYQVVSPLGRVRRFPKVYYDLCIDSRWRNGGYEIPVDIRNQAYNAPNQSAASDCAVFIMCNMQRLIHKRRLPAKFVLTVYDSFMIEAENNKDVISEIIGIAEMAVHDILPASPLFQWLKVPLKLEYCVGPSWGDLEEIKV